MIRKTIEENSQQLLRKLHYKSFKELKKHTPKNTTQGLVPLLRFIQDDPLVTQNQLAQKMYVSKAALSQWIIKLEEDDYLKRTINSEDRREKLVHLTPKGEKLLEDNHRVAQKLHQKLFLPLSDNELSTLEKLLTKITGEMDD